MTAMEEPRTAPESATGEEIGLAEIVGFFRRQWLTIVVCAALAVLVTVVYLGLFAHPVDLVAGESIVFNSGVEIGGSFSAGIRAGACP